MSKHCAKIRTWSDLHHLPTDAIGLAWLVEIVAVDARKAAPSYWHQHRQLEVIYCLYGEMSYDFRDRPSITLPGGTAIIIPPGVEHRITSGVDTPCRRLSILVNAALPRQSGYTVFSRAEFKSLCQAMLAKAFRPAVFSRTAADNLNFLWSAGMSGKAAESPLMASKLRLLICSVIHESAVSSMKYEPRESGHLIDEAIGWLENHIGETVRIPQLVAHIGYGRARFFALFKERTGLSPADYLRRMRIRRAEELIRESPRRPISEISREVGFRDPSHFSATFRRMTGKTPGGCWK